MYCVFGQWEVHIAGDPQEYDRVKQQQQKSSITSQNNKVQCITHLE